MNHNEWLFKGSHQGPRVILVSGPAHFSLRVRPAEVGFLKRAFPDAGHIFTDMADVAKGRAKDVKRDGGWQAVPEAWSGFLT